MRNKMRAVSLFTALLAVILSSVLASPAFASGDDKPAIPASTATASPTASPVPAATRPDREKKVFTNDDIDQMWPKPVVGKSDSPTSEVRTGVTVPVARRSAAVSRAVRTAGAPATREYNPLWYAAQVESLYAELDSISSREASLRDFRATGSDAGVTVGLQFYAPCEGITTDNAILQLESQRQEIVQQISDLQNTAEQNGMPPAVIQDPSEVLQAARKPLTPGQERAALIERQSELIGKLAGVQNQLADISNQAAKQGIVLLPVTPGQGGDLLTNRIQSLDARAGQLRNALGENEDAARQAGLAPSALP
jgi:hypothetical protein